MDREIRSSHRPAVSRDDISEGQYLNTANESVLRISQNTRNVLSLTMDEITFEFGEEHTKCTLSMSVLSIEIAGLGLADRAIEPSQSWGTHEMYSLAGRGGSHHTSKNTRNVLSGTRGHNGNYKHEPPVKLSRSTSQTLATRPGPKVC